MCAKDIVSFREFPGFDAYVAPQVGLKDAPDCRLRFKDFVVQW